MSVTVKAGFNKYEFNFRKFKKALDVAAQRQRDHAIREFITTVLSNVPVLTGESAGTLLPLGRLTRIKMATAINSYISRGRANAKGRDGWDRPGGAERGAGKASASLVGSEGSANYGFTWEMDVRHFAINNFNAMNYKNGQKPTPWEAIEKGVNAFNDYMARYAIDDLPDFDTFIEERRT